MRNTQFGVCSFRCKVYVHCIHCVYGHSGDDWKDKRFTFLHVVFTCNVFTYIQTRSVIKLQRLDNMGPKRP